MTETYEQRLLNQIEGWPAEMKAENNPVMSCEELVRQYKRRLVEQRDWIEEDLRKRKEQISDMERARIEGRYAGILQALTLMPLEMETLAQDLATETFRAVVGQYSCHCSLSEEKT